MVDHPASAMWGSGARLAAGARVLVIEEYMKNLLGLSALATGGLLLSSCVTTPYETAFNGCENEANSCYRICEDIPDERGYIQCQEHCDQSANRCFDQAYAAYQNQNYGYGNYGYGSRYGSPWYGRYGSWYPSYGFYLGYNNYDRYGHRKRKPHPPGYGSGYQPPRGGYNNPPRPPRGGYNNPPSGSNNPPRPPRGGYNNPRPPRGGNQPPIGQPPAGQPPSSPPPSYTPPPSPPPRYTPPPRSSDDRPQRRPSVREPDNDRQPD